MYEDIQEMYIEEEIDFDFPTYTDVIVGQLTYRVHHTTNKCEEQYYQADPDADADGYYSYDCYVTRVELMDEHCVVLTDVTDKVPTWFLQRLAITIEKHAEAME